MRLVVGMGYRPMPYIDSTLIRFKQGQPDSYKTLIDSIDNYLEGKSAAAAADVLCLAADSYGGQQLQTKTVFSERELKFMFVICHRPSVCRLSVCRLSVTLVHPTQAIEIFGNISTPCGTFAILDLCMKNFTEIVPGEPLRRGS